MSATTIAKYRKELWEYESVVESISAKTWLFRSERRISDGQAKPASTTNHSNNPRIGTGWKISHSNNQRLGQANMISVNLSREIASF